MPPTQPQNKETELDKKLMEIGAKRIQDEASALAQKLGLSYSDLKSAPVDIDALVLIDEATARKGRMAIIIKSGVNLTIVVLDPQDQETSKTLKELEQKGFKINIIITNPDSLEKILARYETAKSPEIFEVGAIEVKEGTLKQYETQINDISDLKNKVTRISATEMLEIMIAGALKFEASDIHFEPEADSTRIRYRLDGVLNDITSIDKDSYDKLLNRIKILSKMKLNIHNVPQDGRFTIREKNVSIEVRVSVLPSEFGEAIVMRLLDP